MCCNRAKITLLTFLFQLAQVALTAIVRLFRTYSFNALPHSHFPKSIRRECDYVWSSHCSLELSPIEAVIKHEFAVSGILFFLLYAEESEVTGRLSCNPGREALPGILGEGWKGEREQRCLSALTELFTVVTFISLE